MNALESTRDLKREYVRRLTDAKKEYEAIIQADIEEYGQKGKEGYNFYGSELEADEPVSGTPSGYFSRNSLHSFHNLGGYSAEGIRKKADAFRKEPVNKGRFVMCLDAFGQGRPGQEFADETVITTLIKTPFKLSPNVTPFYGDALSKNISSKVFRHLTERIRQGGALLVTFFRPVEGLRKVSHNLYVYHQLYENLRKIYEFTEEGGLIFISATGGGFNINILKDMLKEFDMSSIATIEEGGHRLLLRKDSSVTKTLPSFEQVLDKDTLMVRILLRVAK